MAQGKVKIKEMGLREGHPEKEGVLVDLKELVPEIRKRLERKAAIDSLVKEAEGLRVVDGIKGEPQTTDNVEEAKIEEKAEVPDPEKPAGETPMSQEAIGAVPAS